MAELPEAETLRKSQNNRKYLVKKQVFLFIVTVCVLLVDIVYVISTHFKSDDREASNNVDTPIASNTLLQSHFVSEFEPLLTEFSEKNIMWKDTYGSTPICAIDILWHSEIRNGGTVILASGGCGNVGGDPNGPHGGFSNPYILFKLQQEKDNWRVAEFFRPDFPEVPPPTWAKSYLEKVPQEILAEAGDHLPSAKFNQRANDKLHLGLPTPSYKSCLQDNQCNTKEVCELNKRRTAGICIQTCTKQESCGAGYECRYQCLHGENGCPSTKVSVCLLSSPDSDLPKTGEPF